MSSTFLPKGHTSKLDVIRHSPDLYTWGNIIKIHNIGDYSIVEYEGEDDGGGLSFAPYTNGKDLKISFATLEKALIYTIAYKHDEVSADAATKMFMRMIEAE